MIDTDKYEGHTEGPWWINHEDGDGATSIWNGTLDEGDMNHVADVDVHDNDLRLIADAPKLLAEVKRLRDLLYKCWKDSGQSLHYLQVELLNDQEYWYEQMICDDDSKRCGDYGIEDCECDEE